MNVKSQLVTIRQGETVKRFLLIVIIAVLTVNAHAQISLGMYAGVGYSGYAMKEINNAIDDLKEQYILIDKIEGGSNIACGLRLYYKSFGVLSLSYQRLNGGTEKSAIGLELDLKVPANVIECALIIRLMKGQAISLSTGAGVGYYICSGEASLNIADTTFTNGDIDGDTVGARLFTEFEVYFSPRFSLILDIGYRIAKAENAEFKGPSVENYIEDYSLDWSGMYFLGGASVIIPVINSE